MTITHCERMHQSEFRDTVPEMFLVVKSPLKRSVFPRQARRHTRRDAVAGEHIPHVRGQAGAARVPREGARRPAQEEPRQPREEASRARAAQGHDLAPRRAAVQR